MTTYATVALSDVANLNPTRPRELLRLSESHEVTFVPMSAVNQHKGEIDRAQVRPFGEVKKGFTYFVEGDVIFAKITPCMQNGKSAIAKGMVNRLGFGSTEFHVIRPNMDRILPEWIWYFVRQLSFRDEATRHFRGAVGQQRVPPDYLANANIPLPPLLEQRRIVNRIMECLERAEEIEGLRIAQEQATSCLMRAARRELFGTADHLLHGWAEVRLDTLAHVIYGISEAISANREPAIGPPIIRMANISLDGQLNLSDLRYCAIPRGRQSHFELKRGDLLLNWRSGSSSHVGKTAIFEEDGLFTCASFILRIRVFPHVDNRYLRHVMNFMRAEGIFSGSSRMQINHKLNAAEFSAFPVRIPPTKLEQESVADQLDAVESLIWQLDKQVSRISQETKLLREAILRKAFAGEL
jgi:type I restriction enzyme S subunit